MFRPRRHASRWKWAAIVVVAACTAVAQPGCDQPAGPNGPAAAKPVEVTDANVKVDFNHPLAGHEVIFTVRVVSVEDGSPDGTD